MAEPVHGDIGDGLHAGILLALPSRNRFPSVGENGQAGNTVALRHCEDATGRPARVSVLSTPAGSFLAMTFLGGNRIRHRIIACFGQVFQ